MTCECHLCRPWNDLAREAEDAERLNELTEKRLAVHGLTPKVSWHEKTRPYEQPTVRLSDFPVAETLWRQCEEERLRLYLLDHMERARGHSRTDPAGADAAPDGG